LASWAVTVIILVDPSAAIVVGAAATVDRAPEAAPAVTVTSTVWIRVVPFTVADSVFTSATVELSVAVATPFTSVRAAGCVSVLPVPVTLNTAASPSTGLPLASRAVTVIVAVSPSAVMVSGLTAMVD
jgi:hypothetical protein